jgi:hypothetical protein
MTVKLGSAFDPSTAARFQAGSGARAATTTLAASTPDTTSLRIAHVIAHLQDEITQRGPSLSQRQAGARIRSPAAARGAGSTIGQCDGGARRGCPGGLFVTGFFA